MKYILLRIYQITRTIGSKKPLFLQWLNNYKVNTFTLALVLALGFYYVSQLTV